MKLSRILLALALLTATSAAMRADEQVISRYELKVGDFTEL